MFLGDLFVFDGRTIRLKSQEEHFVLRIIVLFDNSLLTLYFYEVTFK